MSRFTNYAENKLADFMRGQAHSLPTNWSAGLASAASDSAITELTGTGYGRQTIARSLVAWAGTQGAGSTLASSGASHITSNNAAVSWGNPGSAWGTANYVTLHDDPTAGACWAYIPISAIVITTGSPNPVQVAIAALQLSLGLAGGCSDYLSNKLIDLIFRGQAFSWPASTYFAAYTVAPTSAGGGTEVGGVGAYARVAVAASLAAWSGTQGAGSTTASSGTGGRSSNNAAISFPSPTADYPAAIVAAGEHDASTTGNLLFSGSLAAPVTILNGGPALRLPADAYGRTVQ